MIMAKIKEMITELIVTTVTANDADFGCPAPTSLLTLMLFYIKPHISAVRPQLIEIISFFSSKYIYNVTFT